MSLRYTTVSFLSDYGLVDEFVGVVHSVIRSIAPDVRVIDVTHAIDAFDVRAGSLALARCAPYLAPGVVIAVVDPGVGSSRRAIAVEVGDGESVLIGPDNGVLAGAVALCGGVTAAIELTNRDVHLDSPGPTFAGRDVFAPVAAQLCLGVPLADLGTPIDPYSLTPGLLGVSHFEGDVLVAEVLWPAIRSGSRRSTTSHPPRRSPACSSTSPRKAPSETRHHHRNGDTATGHPGGRHAPVRAAGQVAQRASGGENRSPDLRPWPRGGRG
jgi:hypothetical protein